MSIKEQIMDWLGYHTQAYEDFERYCKGENMELKDVGEDFLIGWISDHETLTEDFCAFFPNIDMKDYE